MGRRTPAFGGDRTLWRGFTDVPGFLQHLGRSWFVLGAFVVTVVTGAGFCATVQPAGDGLQGLIVSDERTLALVLVVVARFPALGARNEGHIATLVSEVDFGEVAPSLSCGDPVCGFAVRERVAVLPLVPFGGEVVSGALIQIIIPDFPTPAIHARANGQVLSMVLGEAVTSRDVGDRERRDAHAFLFPGIGVVCCGGCRNEYQERRECSVLSARCGDMVPVRGS